MAVDEHSTAHPSNRRRSSAHLFALKRSDARYVQVEKLFVKGWKHPHKPKPAVRAIYKVLLPDEVLELYSNYCSKVRVFNLLSKYSKGANEQLLFHGTTRTCLIGEDIGNVHPCSMESCSLCGIVRKSFDVAKCGSKHSFQRFGSGIYTTTCSSKADDYFTNKTRNSNLRVLLVSRVVVGKPYKRLRTDRGIRGPPCGYHSVLGVPGVDLNYEETVVYDNDAIRPAYLVVYDKVSLPLPPPPPPIPTPPAPHAPQQHQQKPHTSLKRSASTLLLSVIATRTKTKNGGGSSTGSRRKTADADGNVDAGTSRKGSHGGTSSIKNAKAQIATLFRTPLASY